MRYNQLVCETDQLTWNQVVDISSSIWNSQLEGDENIVVVPKSIRLTAINSYVKGLRAAEEKELLKEEMCNVIKFYMQQYHSIQSALENLNSLQSTSEFNRGCIFMLEARLFQCKKSIYENYVAFKDHVVLPDIPVDLTDHFHTDRHLNEESHSDGPENQEQPKSMNENESYHTR